MSESEEILKVLSNEDLLQLRDIYKKYEDIYPHVYSLIDTKLKWNEENNDGLIVFMSPGDSWKVDGTFLYLKQILAPEIFVFTLDEKCRNLARALRETRLIDFSKVHSFELVHSIHHGVVTNFIEDGTLVIKDTDPCDILRVPREEALNFQIECPDEVYVKKLDKSHSEEINAIWPHSYPNSEKYLSSLIDLNGGYGVFLKESGEIVAWIIKNVFGQLGMLQTVDSHKGKGYGSLITKVLSKEIAEDGHQPLGTALVNNIPAQKMFKNLGFRSIGLCYYFTISRQ